MAPRLVTRWNRVRRSTDELLDLHARPDGPLDGFQLVRHLLGLDGVLGKHRARSLLPLSCRLPLGVEGPGLGPGKVAH